eukprot:15481653-Alexandrium_andersonii.AAC.1
MSARVTWVATNGYQPFQQFPVLARELPSPGPLLLRAGATAPPEPPNWHLRARGARWGVGGSG